MARDSSAWSFTHSRCGLQPGFLRGYGPRYRVDGRGGGGSLHFFLPERLAFHSALPFGFCQVTPVRGLTRKEELDICKITALHRHKRVPHQTPAS